MRRLIVALMVVSLLGSAGPTAASTPGGASAAVGPFRGRSAFEFGAAGCSFVHQTFDATFLDASGGSGSFHFTGCVELTTPFTYEGTLKLRHPDGTMVRGTVAGTIAATAPPVPCSDPNITGQSLSFRLTPSSGPAIRLRGTWCSTSMPSVADEILGRLSS